MQEKYEKKSYRKKIILPDGTVNEREYEKESRCKESPDAIEREFPPTVVIHKTWWDNFREEITWIIAILSLAISSYPYLERWLIKYIN